MQTFFTISSLTVPVHFYLHTFCIAYFHLHFSVAPIHRTSTGPALQLHRGLTRPKLVGCHWENSPVISSQPLVYDPSHHSIRRLESVRKKQTRRKLHPFEASLGGFLPSPWRLQPIESIKLVEIASRARLWYIFSSSF